MERECAGMTKTDLKAKLASSSTFDGVMLHVPAPSQKFSREGVRFPNSFQLCAHTLFQLCLPYDNRRVLP
jgi:hypothetical protein